MRGKLPVLRRELTRSGLIPAHAGKTFPRAVADHRPAAHPRPGGENACGEALTVVSVGSSPLTRGKYRHSPCLRDISGLIPAHTGKTSTHRSPPTTSPAHPHSRRENFWILPLAPGIAGSSPLTQGKPLNHGLQRLAHGLIPTHAGKTVTTRQLASPTRAHPHSRGENSGAIRHRDAIGGSSPLTQGKLQIGELTPPAHRLIPAHGGKTPRTRPRLRSASAHPRTRGENSGATRHRDAIGGSSPPTREKHEYRSHVGGESGLIPAHAGKT